MTRAALPISLEDRILRCLFGAYAGALAVVLAIRAVVEGEWSNGRSFLEIAASGLPDSAVRDALRP